MASLREKYGYLPHVCVLLLEGEGEEFMLRVVERLGGSDVLIPERLSETSVLVRELGEEDARKVWEIWRGLDGPSAAKGECRVFIPTMAETDRKTRRAQILSLRRNGVTVREIARRFRASERTIYNEIRRAIHRGETQTGEGEAQS